MVKIRRAYEALFLGLFLFFLLITDLRYLKGWPVSLFLEATPLVLGFNQQFGSGTPVGTTGTQSVVLVNLGLSDLVLSSVALSGDNVFTVQGPNGVDQQPKTTLKTNEQAFLQAQFRPSDVRKSTGTLTIKSNDAAHPSLDLRLSGCGVDPDGGTAAYCLQADGGF